MILITGATGYLGNALLARLAGNAIGIARKPSSSEAVFECDLTDPVSVGNLVEQLNGSKIDTIIHAAGVTPWSSTHKWELDLEMAQQVVRLATLLGAAKIIYLSGWVVYDGGGSSPYSEDQTATTTPSSEYGISKLAVERYLAKQFSEGTVVSLRLASVYGPGQTSAGLIPNLVHEAISSGTMTIMAKKTKRDYLYIDDAVAAIVKLLGIDIHGSQSINIGSGRSVSVLEVAQTIQQAVLDECGRASRIVYSEHISESPIIDNQMGIKSALKSGVLGRNLTTFSQGIRMYVKSEYAK